MSEHLHKQTLRELPPEWDSLTRRIISAAVQVHRTLGPGMLESLYEEAMCVELRHVGLRFEQQRPIAMAYRDHPIGDMRVDLIVENLVIVELKAIERVLDMHKAQLLSYLRSADLPIGLLINFHHATLIEGLTRRVNERSSRMSGLPFAASTAPSLSVSASVLSAPPSSSPISAISEFQSEPLAAPERSA